MIKFTAKTADGGKLVGIGLSHENLKRLKDNSPIRFKGEAIGLPDLDFLIFSGKSEEAMAKWLAPGITAETIVHDTSDQGQ